MTSDDRAETTRLLSEWTSRVSDELGLDAAEVDIDAVLALAGTVAHAVVRPAAPLTTFLVGYAAGQAAAGGQLPPREAVGRAIAQVAALAAAARAAGLSEDEADESR
jgi:hydrogenase/urease accessory protein HupE